MEELVLNKSLESKRLRALADYQVMDTLPEYQFDSITRLAAYICKTPISLISLVDDHCQWFKSKVGLDTPGTPSNISFCRYTIQSDEIFEIPDALIDPRFADNPLVTGEPNIRFYAGAPLITPEGLRLGSLCVIDRKPNSLDDEQRDALRILASQVISHFEVAKKTRQLKESLARYEEFNNMFNTSSELHCILDSKGTIEIINNAAVDLLGYDPAEMKGISIWKFAVREDEHRILKYLQQLLHEGARQFDFETRIVTKQGEVKCISWAASAKGGKWFSNGRDITKEKLLLAELEQLSLVANRVDNGVVISDASNEVIWVNPSFEKITGFNRADMAGHKLGDIIKGKDTDESTIKTARELTKNKKSFSVELLAYRKDGQPIWLSVMNSVILNEAGEFDKVVEIITDISERKKYEERLETLSIAASKSSSGIFVRNAAGGIVWVNEAFEQISGYKLDELKGQIFGAVFMGPETDLSVFEEAKKAVAEKRPYEIEILVYQKDGTPTWIFLSNNPIFNNEGEVERQVGIVVDITERKKVEKELIKTREEALELSKAKELFVSVMSHEIRTPLNAVIGMAHILMDDNPTPSQLEHLDILKFSAENLLSLLNAILDFTKIETGNMVLESVELNLRELVTRTMDSFLFKAREKNIALKQEIDLRIPDRIMGDQTRLYQVLINLIGNSIKFTHQGEVKLSLSLVTETDKEVTIKFNISDTGIGIEKDKVDYIFEAYTQARSDTSRKYGGTGLGLAITKRIIELYGSLIKVSSEVGKGSSFVFIIPFKKAGARATIENATVAKNFNAKVLVVDDNDINRMLARKVLSKWGIRADVAENGKIALDKILVTHYDLVLMDIHMPEMGGFEAVRAIRKQDGPYFKSLPIIALTASIMSDEINTITDAGMNDYVQKPFAPNDLYKKIEKYLSLPA